MLIGRGLRRQGLGRIDLQNKQRAYQKRDGHRYQRGIVAPEALNHAAEGHRRERRSELAAHVHGAARNLEQGTGEGERSHRYGDIFRSACILGPATDMQTRSRYVMIDTNKSRTKTR